MNQKTKTKVIIITVTMMSILAVGCGNKGNQLGQQNLGQQTTSPEATPYQSNAIRQQTVPLGNRVEIAKQAAFKVVRIPGVRTANVLVTQRNAYVAAVLADNIQFSREMENIIAKQVRAADPNIKNVYVSTNPDFVNRVNTYVKDVQQGRPVSGFFEEFNRMVQRIFPKAH
jgi:YhcN/YlaJ family sporulation lipoprotein